jgi:intracellular multiplication protein IcmE
MSESDTREELCRTLNIESVQRAYELVLTGARKPPEWLLKRGLNAEHLKTLGYDTVGMRKMGYTPTALAQLGYNVPVPEENVPAPQNKEPEKAKEKSEGPSADEGSERDPKALIEKGYGVHELKPLGITAHHCKLAGVEPRELFRLGYTLDDLVPEFNAAELRLIGFNARELSRYFSGEQLRRIGFSAVEMHNAGYSVRDLIRFGYSENHVVTAGYSVHELASAGLSKHTHGKMRGV